MEYWLLEDDCEHPREAREVWGMNHQFIVHTCTFCGAKFKERLFSFQEIRNRQARQKEMKGDDPEDI